jgi:hypothetical protein
MPVDVVQRICPGGRMWERFGGEAGLSHIALRRGGDVSL